MAGGRSAWGQLWSPGPAAWLGATSSGCPREEGPHQMPPEAPQQALRPSRPPHLTAVQIET